MLKIQFDQRGRAGKKKGMRLGAESCKLYVIGIYLSDTDFMFNINFHF